MGCRHSQNIRLLLSNEKWDLHQSILKEVFKFSIGVPHCHFEIFCFIIVDYIQQQIKNIMTSKQTKKYFRDLLQEQAEKDQQQLKQILLDIFQCKRNVFRSIREGDLEIKQSSIPFTSSKDQLLQASLKSKRSTLQRQLQALNKDLFQSQESYKKAKQQIYDQRHDVLKHEKEQKAKKAKQIEEKVKKWSDEQKQFDKRRQESLQKMKMKIKETERQIKQMEEQQLLNEKLEKQKNITDRLKRLEENKDKRKQLFAKSRSNSVDKQPLFLELQKKHKQYEDEKKFQQNIARKNHKLMTKIDHESLRIHEKQYLTRIQERKRIDQSKVRAHSSENGSEFSLFPKRDEQKIKEDAEKRKRRIKFQTKIKQIPIEIDEAKRVKIQIERDKAQNPFKYAFLSQKSLNDFQIYGEFKDFAMNVNPRELGKGYLQEIKKKSGQSRVGRSSSVQVLKQTPSQKIQYRNYLHQFKTRRMHEEGDLPPIDEIDKIIKKNRNKQQALIQLKKKSQLFEMEALKKKKDSKSLHGYKQTVKKQSQADNEYMKALKAKIACLQIS